MLMPTDRTRPLRRDALANRTRILDHAEKVFADEGLDVSLHRIAEDLGLGIGTVYRHFATLDDLYFALYERIGERIDAVGDEFMTLDDPFAQVVAVLDGTIRISLEMPIARMIGARVQRRFPERVKTNRWAPVVAATVERAQAEGVIRADVHATDIAVMAGMLADLVSLPEPRRSLILPRSRALVIDALRPEGAPRDPLPDAPISLETLTEIAHTRRANRESSP